MSTTGTIASLDAKRHLPGDMTSCSWRSGWRSLLLRGYRDRGEAEFVTPATPDHLIVLVVDGACQVEGRYRSAWNKASYKAGCIGMSAPGEEVSLRWRRQPQHSTLQMHIPERTLRAVYEDFADRSVRAAMMPNGLLYDDPLIASAIQSLSRALGEGAPDLYADTTGHFLASHLLVRHAKAGPKEARASEDSRLRRVDDFFRANLGTSISLDEIAKVAGVNRFHVLRITKKAYNETPFQRLTRMRMDEAKRRLANSNEPVTAIAFACGYENPAHFASAFKRLIGVTPRQYRAAKR